MYSNARKLIRFAAVVALACAALAALDASMLRDDAAQAVVASSLSVQGQTDQRDALHGPVHPSYPAGGWETLFSAVR